MGKAVICFGVFLVASGCSPSSKPEAEPAKPETTVSALAALGVTCDGIQCECDTEAPSESEDTCVGIGTICKALGGKEIKCPLDSTKCFCEYGKAQEFAALALAGQTNFTCTGTQCKCDLSAPKGDRMWCGGIYKACKAKKSKELVCKLDTEKCHCDFATAIE